jgi:hypothetical protein
MEEVVATNCYKFFKSHTNEESDNNDERGRE